MIEAALSSESAGKFATSAAANATTSAPTLALQTSMTATAITGESKATGATAAATAPGLAKSSASDNYTRTSRLGLIHLAGVVFLFMWN